MSHILPDCVVLNISDTVVSLIHITHCEVERKVHDCLLRGIINVFEAKEVFHRSPKNDHVGLVAALLFGLFNYSPVFIFILIYLTAHKVKERHMQTQQCLITFLKLDDVLSLDLVVSGHKECLESLPRELFLLLLKIILALASRILVDHLVLLLRFSATEVFHVVSFNGEESWVALVPEALDGDAVFADLHLHEVVHVDIVDVELGIGDAHVREGRLVCEDAQLLTLTVQLDVLDFTKGLSILDFEFTRHTDLLVLATTDIKNLDHIVLGNHSHVPTLDIHKCDFPFSLSHGYDLLDLASK